MKRLVIGPLMHPILPLLLVIMAILLPGYARAETVQQLFDAGLNEYRQGNYDRAAGIFQDLYQKYDVSSPDVLVNLGAAEFSAGHTGPAMTWLLKTVRIAPETKAAAVDLDRIRTLQNEQQNNDGGSSIYVFGPYTDGWTALFSWLEPGIAMTIFLVCWALFFLVLAVRRIWEKRLQGAIIGVALVLTMVTGGGALASARIAGYRTGVILNDDTPLTVEIASTEAAAGLPEGLEFRIVEIRGAWVHIRLSSGLTGWIPEDDAGIP